MKRLLLLCGLVAALWAGPAAAQVKVVATIADLAQVAEAVGGERVEVTLLCPGHNDPHHLPAKPSLARALGKADLLLYNGLELEVGWLPLLLQKARNPRVRPGAPGDLDCSAALQNVLDVPQGAVDRSHGDIHPLGNPHYTLDPRAMREVAHLVSHRLAELDPEHAADYAAGGEAYAAAITEKLPEWEAAVAAARDGHVLLYHQTWNYLVHWLRLDVYGEIEHRPGIAPSPKHVQGMIDKGRELGDVIVVAATWSHVDTARQAAERIGAPLAVLPAASGAEEGVDTYIDLMDTIVARLAAAAAERSAP